MTVRLIIASLTLAAATYGDAIAAGCRPCTIAGPPSHTRCVPNGGILGFQSNTPTGPAYWTLTADSEGAQSKGRLDGTLAVWADYTFPLPNVPGLPATCDATDHICFGTPARFAAAARKDRLRGTARYPDGSVCEFRGRIDFGLGDPELNNYVCRTPSGEVQSTGGFQVELIRLSGCHRPPRITPLY